ncbi:hypothetical protein HKD37_07G020487 [Glycine soja]
MTIDKYPWPSKTVAHNHTIKWLNKALVGKATHIGNQSFHPLLYDKKASGNMASEAPSWADQWGAGGIGAMEDDDTISQKETGKNKSSGSKGAFGKVKATASNCVKWLKSLCKRKSTTK